MATDLQNLAKIFNNRIFRIPDFQRGFAWGEKQLSDFWSDLNRVGDDRTHYCGQLTLEKVDEKDWGQWEGDEWLIDDAGYDPYFVVDGQQRLTTSIILLQCLLDGIADSQLMAGQKASDHRERYLAKGNGIVRSCLFGYAKDNPSHEYFRTQILGVPSNEYQGTLTVYTSNLQFAKDFFEDKVAEAKLETKERLLKALVQRFKFNLHELSDDIDVFVAFETMNNRGKPLSRLELLKNRLIYLSTLAETSEAERLAVRRNINAVWRTVYEELGRNPAYSLDDDEFLRSHWIVYFGYDKDEADPLTKFLLNKHFTTQRLDAGELTLTEIQDYVDDLQNCARVWQRLYFPENHREALGATASPLVRVKRLGFGVLQPLLLACLAKGVTEAGLLETICQAERFLLLVRSLAKTRSDIAGPQSFRKATAIHKGTENVSHAAEVLESRVERHFSSAEFQANVDNLFAEEGKGYYSLPSIKFLLFEYEEELRREAKATETKISWEDFRGARKSVEHVFPQDGSDEDWPAFKGFDVAQKNALRHSIGNLVAVSVAKNASLSRSPFTKKKVGTDAIPGFSQGSFSELKIAAFDDWTSKEILNRGIEFLNFIEARWGVNFGDRASKIRLLKLQFVKETRADSPAGH